MTWKCGCFWLRGAGLLRLVWGQAESLWDEALPVEVRQLPEELAALGRLLSDPALLAPIVARFRREVDEQQRAVLTDGRPTIAMETYVRLMVLKQRYRWGYRVLVAEVSDSIHLRRFCRISLSERVPDESTVRKLTRRLGAETVSELTRALIVKARREQRFRPRAVRIDSTVVEGDVRYPTDAGLAWHGVRALAREGRKLAGRIGETKRRVRDRSRAMGRRLRAITRTIRRRSGAAKAEVLKLTAQTGALLERSISEASRLAGAATSARPRCAGQAQGRGETRAAGRPLRAGLAADSPARCRRADQRSARVARRPRRAPDPQGQARQAHRVRVRDAAGGSDRAHQARRAWADRARGARTRQPDREHAAARHRRATQAAGDLAARGRPRWWLSARPDERGAGRAGTAARVHRRPPGAPLQTHQAAPLALSHRQGGPHQPPQAPLRPPPQPPQRRRGPADLD